MTAEKFSASMDSRTLVQARAAASEEGVSLSSWLYEAARDRLRLRGLRHAILEYEAEHGELTDEELEAVRQEVAAVGQELAAVGKQVASSRRTRSRRRAV